MTASRIRYARLATERVNPRSRALDRLTPREIAALMNREDRRAVLAVGRVRRQIAAAVDMIVAALRLVRRGLVVRPIPEEQILEVFAVWGALDQLAARLAVEHSTLSDRSRMIWLNERIKIASDRLEQANLPDLNMRFHMALCEAAHNSVLLQMVRQIHYSVVRFGNDVQRAWSRLGCHRRTFRIIEAVDRGRR